MTFGKVAKSENQTLKLTPYAPTPLPSGDPFGIVLTPLLVGGYLSATVLRMALGSPPPRLGGAILLATAVVATLLVNLIVEPWLHGYPASKFWIVWPILILIMVVPALFAAVMQRLLGAIGTFVTVIVIILLGKPSSGGANGVAYLPGFWTTIGPFLPPRNAHILLRNTIYFDANGISQEQGANQLGRHAEVVDPRRRLDARHVDDRREDDQDRAHCQDRGGIGLPQARCFLAQRGD